MRQLIDLVRQRWTIALQFYRVLGVIFLILHASGNLPGLFAWAGGSGRRCGRAAGAGCCPLRNGEAIEVCPRDLVMERARHCGSEHRDRNGIPTSPSALQLGGFGRSDELAAAFPLVLIPAFLVPLSFLLHAVSLIKLARATPSRKASGRAHGSVHRMTVMDTERNAQ